VCEGERFQDFKRSRESERKDDTHCIALYGIDEMLVYTRKVNEVQQLDTTNKIQCHIPRRTP
jgi:hypothetical protein